MAMTKNLRKWIKIGRLNFLFFLDRYSVNKYNLKKLYLLTECFYEKTPNLIYSVRIIYFISVVCSLLTFYFVSEDEALYAALARFSTRTLFFFGVWITYAQELKFLKQNSILFPVQDYRIIKLIILFKAVLRTIVLFISFIVILGCCSYVLILADIEIYRINKENTLKIIQYQKMIDDAKKSIDESS